MIQVWETLSQDGSDNAKRLKVLQKAIHSCCMHGATPEQLAPARGGRAVTDSCPCPDMNWSNWKSSSNEQTHSWQTSSCDRQGYCLLSIHSSPNPLWKHPISTTLRGNLSIQMLTINDSEDKGGTDRKQIQPGAAHHTKDVRRTRTEAT